MMEIKPQLDYGKINYAMEFKTFPREWKDSFRSLYIECGDPTGYVFAEKYVEGGYRKWRSIEKSYEAKDEVDEWRLTLEVKIQSAALLNIAANKESFQANKWLVDRGWAEKEDKRTKEGRKRASMVDSAVTADMERIGFGKSAH